MAEKHRFKKDREFKKRLDEQEENEGADIRSFKFHSLDDRKPKTPREPRDFRNARKPDNSRKSGYSKDSRKGRDARSPRDNRDFRKPFKGKRDFNQNNRRFDDDED